MTVASKLRDFHAGRRLAVDLFNEAEALTGVPNLRRSLFVEAAFLRLLITWEVFVEDVLLEFLMGESGSNGNAYSPLVRPSSRAKARRVLLGERDYHTWTSAKAINDRAEYWLGSNVSFAAGLGLVNLKRIYIVRNRIAHNSGSAKERFDIERKLIVPGRPHYKSFGPGQVLRDLSTGPAVFIRFADDLGKAADKIAEGP